MVIGGHYNSDKIEVISLYPVTHPVAECMQDLRAMPHDKYRSAAAFRQPGRRTIYIG